MIHLQIEIVGDFSPEFFCSESVCPVLAPNLLGQKQPKFILLGQTIILPIVDRRRCIKKEGMGSVN